MSGRRACLWLALHYGQQSACSDVANRLDTSGDNWYLGVRIYRPVEAIIKGDYTMPVPEPVKQQ